MEERGNYTVGPPVVRPQCIEFLASQLLRFAWYGYALEEHEINSCPHNVLTLHPSMRQSSV